MWLSHAVKGRSLGLVMACRFVLVVPASPRFPLSDAGGTPASRPAWARSSHVAQTPPEPGWPLPECPSL